MSHDDYDQKYTKPDLRRKIKDELMKSDKGGKAGEWSARKSQLLVQEYERQGGGYKNDQKDQAAKSLEEWQDQDWQTKDGDQRARTGDATKRYLPKEVWERLSPEERREAEQSKVKGSKKGEQHIDWTPAVKRAMREVEREHQGGSDAPSKQELYERAKELGVSGRSTMNKDELDAAVRKAERGG